LQNREKINQSINVTSVEKTFTDKFMPAIYQKSHGLVVEDESGSLVQGDIISSQQGSRDTGCMWTVHRLWHRRSTTVSWTRGELSYLTENVCVAWLKPCVSVCANKNKKPQNFWGGVADTLGQSGCTLRGRCLHLGIMPRYLVWRVPFSGESIHL
jgi:hypothetical protein